MKFLDKLLHNKCQRVGDALMKEHEKYSKKLSKIELSNANGFYVQGVLHGILLARRIMAEEMNGDKH